MEIFAPFFRIGEETDIAVFDVVDVLVD